MTKRLIDYPVWVCDACATKAGGHIPGGHLATFHTGECSICHQTTRVTEPRDYGHFHKEGLRAAGFKRFWMTVEDELDPR